MQLNKCDMASYYFNWLRLLIFQNSPYLEMLKGEIEVDESYFGGYRKGKCGQDAARKVAVFGFLKRNGMVYTIMVPKPRQ